MLKKLRSALVTGANGFIGSALVRRLASESFKVSCLVRKGSSPDRLRNGLNVSVIAIDRYAPETLRAALDGLEVDVVFNLASAGVNPADREPLTLLNGNVHVIVGLLLALHAHKPERFIHIGSCAEYAPVTPGHSKDLRIHVWIGSGCPTRNPLCSAASIRCFWRWRGLTSAPTVFGRQA
jgi:nucleoside-diphosphate-sugar epimerase